MNCKICNNSENNRFFEVKEMMFGYRDIFQYMQCENCKCLQITSIPENISKYYPERYYSFSNTLKTQCQTFFPKALNHIKSFLSGYRAKYNSIKGLSSAQGFKSVKNFKLSKESRILDIGCGSGKFLYALKCRGYKNLLGVDPFLEEDIKYDNGLEIHKISVRDISGSWDLIMMHHSFEHMAHPLEILQKVSKLLTSNGVCLIRIPTVSSLAWQKYGINWVQLDAPRHFFLHSIESLTVLADLASLSIRDIVNDATGFQFWGSELYVQNIPLRSKNSYAENKFRYLQHIFQMVNYEHMAKILNKKNQGDQIAVYMQKN